MPLRSYNRLAGWCDPGDSPTPNRACQAQATSRMPLDEPQWRTMVAGLVEERRVPLISHAVPYWGADTSCGRQGVVGSCFEQAADALVDFAKWAEQNLSPEARQRIIIAHLGFLQDDDRLVSVLDAGLSVDLTQTSFTSEGCELRKLVAAHPDQVLFGTDISTGSSCMPQHYEAWVWALLGPAGRSRRFPNTCRGTLRPVGAELGTVDACGIDVVPGAGRKVLHDNAARLLTAREP